MQTLPCIEETKESKSFYLSLKKSKFTSLLSISGHIYATSVYNQLPPDMIGGFAVSMVMGILLWDIKLKIPILKDIGGPVILALLISSIMSFYNLINPVSMEAVQTLM